MPEGRKKIVPTRIRKPTICAGCHLDYRAFAPARFQPLATTSEFGRDFSHLAHVKGLGDGGQNGFCQRCHQGRFEVQPTAQSHGTCAPCHGSDAAPRMTECAGCHNLGKPNGALAARDPKYAWYVRAQFNPVARARLREKRAERRALARMGAPALPSGMDASPPASYAAAALSGPGGDRARSSRAA